MCPVVGFSFSSPEFASKDIFRYALPALAPPAQLVLTSEVVIAPIVPFEPVSDSNSLDSPRMFLQKAISGNAKIV